jgi:hypothetical protein
MELDKLAPDFVALQAELSPVDKSADNPFFKSKFAPLPEVRKAMQPILAKHNFGLSVFPTIIRDEVGKPQNGLRFILLHASGQYIDGEWLLTPAKNDSQGQGADTTYKRRYGEMGITGAVADDDDDGHYASQPRPVAAAKTNGKPVTKSDADLKRDELRDYATKQKLDLAKVAAKFAATVKVDGKPVELKNAPADDIESFIVSLETGVVTV